MNYEIRKLDVGGILDQSIKLVKENFKLLFTIYAVAALPLHLIFMFLQLNVTAKATNPTEQMPYLLAFVGFFPFWILGFMLFNAATTHGIASLYVSRPTDFGDCLRSGAKRLLPLIWTGFLTSLACFGGLFLLCVGAILFGLWFMLAQQVCVIEGLNGPSAMGRSKALMKDNLGKAFVLSLVVSVVNGGIGVAANLFPHVYMQAILHAVLGGVTSIFASATLVVFYFSARCEHENFDLQILTASIAEDSQSPE